MPGPSANRKKLLLLHDPEQQEKRAAARRNGGFMRDHLSRLPRQAAGQAVEAFRTPSRTDAPALLPVDVPYLYVRTRDDITDRVEEIFNRPLATQQDRDRARVQLYALSIQSAKLAAEERKERDAARAAERAAIRAERAAERAAREAFTKQAIERAVERAVQQALAKAAGKAVEASPPAEPEKPEEPIIIDASKPWDLRQFGGKKPRISCVVPVFTSMRTGKIIDVNEPNPLDPPEHMLRDEFRRKPATPSAPAAPPASAEAAQCDATKAAREHIVGGEDLPKRGEDLYQGTTSVVPKERENKPFLAAAGTRGPRPFSDKDAARDFAEENGGGSATEERHSPANGDKSDPEPRDAKPKKDPNNPYSITTLLPDPPRPFESKPRDPCTDPPETPPPPKPKPGPRLHPWIEYWGLH